MLHDFNNEYNYKNSGHNNNNNEIKIRNNINIG